MEQKSIYRKPLFLLRFQKIYALLALILFATEVCIALFAHDRFVRPYLGDFLVVILLYCFVRSFLKSSPLKVAVGVLFFAYAVEISQYFQLVNRLGFQNDIIRIIVGSSFAWSDMLAYTLGICVVLLFEKNIHHGLKSQS